MCNIIYIEYNFKEETFLNKIYSLNYEFKVHNLKTESDLKLQKICKTVLHFL